MKTFPPGPTFYAAVGLAMAVVVAPVMGQESDQEQQSKFNYTVVDGEYADESTITGFEVYTGTCAACHGPDGLGSAFAPSLVRAVQRRDFGDFAQTIAEGRSVQPGFVMPSFAEDERVMTHIEDLWNYLGARAVGGLDRGRPQPLEEADEAGEAEENEE